MFLIIIKAVYYSIMLILCLSEIYKMLMWFLVGAASAPILSLRVSVFLMRPEYRRVLYQNFINSRAGGIRIIFITIPIPV